jgi:hypothetical protein
MQAGGRIPTRFVTFKAHEAGVFVLATSLKIFAAQQKGNSGQDKEGGEETLWLLVFSF